MEEKYNYVNLLISGYLGVMEIDEYVLKPYVLKDIYDHLITYIKKNNLSIDIDTKKKELMNIPLKAKLQDSLLVLNKINGPMELKIIIKRKIAKPRHKKDE